MEKIRSIVTANSDRHCAGRWKIARGEPGIHRVVVRQEPGRRVGITLKFVIAHDAHQARSGLRDEQLVIAQRGGGDARHAARFEWQIRIRRVEKLVRRAHRIRQSARDTAATQGVLAAHRFDKLPREVVAPFQFARHFDDDVEVTAR